MRIASLNVNGLRSAKKRSQTLHHLRHYNISIAAIQEPHWDIYINNDYQLSFCNIRFFMNHYVGFLLLDPTVIIQEIQEIHSHIIAGKLQLPDSTYSYILSIYLPTGHGAEPLRNDILEVLMDFPTDLPWILLGDFNTYPNHDMDHSRRYKHVFKRRKIKEMMWDKMLVDLWRMQNISANGFTHKSTAGTRARIDFIIASPLFLQDWVMDPPHYCPTSDHSLLFIKYTKHKKQKNNYFKPFPTILLQHKGLKKVLQAYSSNLCDKWKDEITSSKWIDIKQSIRIFGWELMETLRKSSEDLLETIEKELDRL